MAPSLRAQAGPNSRKVRGDGQCFQPYISQAMRPESPPVQREGGLHGPVNLSSVRAWGGDGQKAGSVLSGRCLFPTSGESCPFLMEPHLASVLLILVPKLGVP